MESKTLTRFGLIAVIIILGVFLLLVPILFNFNHEIASFYIGNLSLIVFSICVIIVILILLRLTLVKYIDVSPGERNIVLCFVGGNLIFIFIFIGLSLNSSKLAIDQSWYALIAILCVIFNGFTSALLAATKSKKIINKVV